MSLKQRLDALERDELDDEIRPVVVCYDGRETPEDPEEQAAYLATLRPDDGSPVVFIAVSDNGRGISPPTPLTRRPPG
jgi:hypothetical protein